MPQIKNDKQPDGSIRLRRAEPEYWIRESWKEAPAFEKLSLIVSIVALLFAIIAHIFAACKQ